MFEITKISAQKTNKDRYNIYLDGKYSFPVSLNVLAKFNLKKGQTLTQDRKQEILDEEAYDKYLNKVLNFINYKIRTQKEIRDRLYRYLYKDIKDKEIISNFQDRILNEVEGMGLVDDKNYAISYIEGKKLSSTPPGKYKIREFLLKKGVDSKIIDECIEDFSDDKELEGAEKEAEKKMKKLDETSYKDKQKLYSLLRRKGYSQHIIKRVVDSYFNI